MATYHHRRALIGWICWLWVDAANPDRTLVHLVWLQHPAAEVRQQTDLLPAGYIGSTTTLDRAHDNELTLIDPSARL